MGMPRPAANAISAAWLIAILSLITVTRPAAAAPDTKPFAIDAEPLAQALMELGIQSDKVIVAPSDLVGDKVSRAVHGTMSPEQALQKILEGSGLTWRMAADGSIAIMRIAGADSTARKGATARLPSATPAPAEDESDRLQEVVVTAGKRGDAERLQDIPVSITAIGQDKIERFGMDNFIDYAREVPGLGFQDLGAAGGRDDIRGGRRLNLRGVESGFDGVPTVAFYLDEAPIPVMDPKLFDIQRIEVLRGPQGTLYGANSMGGAVRVVMNQPVQDRFDYRGDATFKSTQFGAPSYETNGMVNAPLIGDELAVRAVGFYRNEGGVIDDYFPADGNTPAHIKKNVDGEESWGARVAASWQPTDQLQITPSIFHQETRVDGSGDWDAAFRDLTVYDRKVQDAQHNNFTLAAVEASWRLDKILLSSSTSYFWTDYNTVEDVTKGFYDVGAISADQVQLSLVQTHAHRISEELRAAYTGTRWNGVAGIFYLDEQRHFNQNYPNADGVSSEIEPELFNGTQSNGETQFALFAEGTLKLIQDFELTGGVRWFRGTQDQHVRFFSYGEPDIEDGHASQSAVSPKVQLSYHFDPDRMVYVSATKGFRPGGPNGVVPTSTCADDLAEHGLTAAPKSFGSDQLWSYEVGSKLAFADNRLTVDTSVYYIDWTNVQQTVLLINCGFTYLGNVGAARSQGFEIELAAKPTEHLKLTGSIGDTDSQFTKSNPDIGVLSGDRLPLVPHWTAAASAQYSFDVWGDHEAYVLVDYQYQDKVLNGYDTDYQKSYSLVNGRLGVNVTRQLELALFVNNIADARPQLFFYNYGDAGLLPPQQREDVITGRPRTVGLTFRFRH
jgi:iron complex outermembrane recepter protein